MPAPNQTGPLRTFITLATLILVGLILYYGQKVLIPLALAILLSLILGPLVGWLQGHGVKRTPAVLLTVFAAFVLLGSAGWVIGLEVHSLALELPKHRQDIADKIASLQGTGGGAFSHLKDMWQQISGEVERMAGGPAEHVQPVRIEETSFAWFPSVVGPVVEFLAEALLVVMLVIFMLIRREDVRNRALRLFGKGRLTMTTRAVDEAITRISRFLVMQSIINLSFGTILALGLTIIGVPYAFLWGMLAAMLRFVPYVGTWIAMCLPLILSIATSEGWGQPIAVLLLFMTIELVTANAIEPLLFSHSTGISPVALLVAVIFWTWLWGPIGLILATPMTTCLVVIGKFVPQLEFLDVLLGDEPALETEVTYYQRLLAHDQDEATSLVEEFLASSPLERVYDEILLPALVLARRDRQAEMLSEEDHDFILQVTRDILEDLVGPQQQIRAVATAPVPAPGEAPKPPPPKAVIFGCPARDETDELALEMLRQLVKSSGAHVEVAASSMLSSEMLDWVREHQPALVCIGSLPPGGMAHARYLCKRLRAEAPDLKIAVGRWGQKDDVPKMTDRLRTAGADFVATTLLESRSQIVPLIPVAGPATTPPAVPPGKAG